MVSMCVDQKKKVNAETMVNNVYTIGEQSVSNGRDTGQPQPSIEGSFYLLLPLGVFDESSIGREFILIITTKGKHTFQWS